MSGINAMQRINSAIRAECEKPQAQRRMLPLNGVHNVPSTSTQKSLCASREVYEGGNISAVSAAWNVVFDVVRHGSQPGKEGSGRKCGELADKLEKQVFLNKEVRPTVLSRMTAMGVLYAAMKRIAADGGVNAEKQKALVSASSRLSDEIRGIAAAVVTSKSKSGGYTGSNSDKPLWNAMKTSALLMHECRELVGKERLAGAILDEVVTPQVVLAVAAKRPDEFKAMMASPQGVDVGAFMNSSRVQADTAALVQGLDNCAEGMEIAISSALKIPAYVKGNHDQQSAKPPDGEASPERAGNGSIAPGINGLVLAPNYYGPTYNNNANATGGAGEGGLGGAAKAGRVRADVRGDDQLASKPVGALIELLTNENKWKRDLIDQLVSDNRQLKKQLVSVSSSGYASDSASIVSADDDGRAPGTETDGGQRPLPSVMDDMRSPVTWRPAPSYMPQSSHLVMQAQHDFARAHFPDIERGGTSALSLGSSDEDAPGAVRNVGGSDQPRRSTVNAQGFGAGFPVPADAELQWDRVSDELAAMSPGSPVDDMFTEVQKSVPVVEDTIQQAPHAEVTTFGKQGGDDSKSAMDDGKPGIHSPVMVMPGAGPGRPSLRGAGAVARTTTRNVGGSDQPQRSTVNAQGFGAGFPVPADAELQWDRVSDELAAMSPGSLVDGMFTEVKKSVPVFEEAIQQAPHAEVTTPGKQAGDDSKSAMDDGKPGVHSPVMVTPGAGPGRPSLRGAGAVARTTTVAVPSGDTRDARWRNYSELFLNYLVPPIGKDVDAPQVSASAFKQYNALCDAESDAVVNAKIQDGTITLRGGALTSRGLSEAEMSVWRDRGREGAARMASPLPSPSHLRIQDHLAVVGLSFEEAYQARSGKASPPIPHETAEVESPVNRWDRISTKAYKEDAWVKHRLSKTTGGIAGQQDGTVNTMLPPRSPVQRPKTLSLPGVVGSRPPVDDAPQATSIVQRKELPRQMTAEVVRIDPAPHMQQSPGTRVVFKTIEVEVPVVSRGAARVPYADELNMAVAARQKRMKDSTATIADFALSESSQQDDRKVSVT